MRITETRGVALVMTLLAISLLSALGLGLALAASTGRMADANHEDATEMLNAIESAIELAARDLNDVADWSAALDGTVRSSLVEPPPAAINVDRLTNQLTCERDDACSDARVHASSADRPWGRNNPRWQVFLRGRLAAVTDPRHPRRPYSIVWLGDDPRETDDDPRIDGGAPGEKGRYVVRARAESFGSAGARRAVEAEFARVCPAPGTGQACLPGIRVQSWHVVIGPVP
ncbi:MAG TPA: hypothetical protein VNJ02_06395 [Vicinamibacterales bacterium]|nr:hypothetical protein [Vicinamibacterales bacterium]